MSIATREFGLADHGQLVTEEELESAKYQPGYKYEIIDGRLYVSPEARLPENRLETWLLRKLWNYADSRPDVANYVSNKSRVFVPRRRRVTVPEPDLAVFADYPVNRPLKGIKWEDLSPILVVEVLYAGDPYKDLVRNLDLFLAVPSIREYWVLDAREDPDEPMLIVHNRRGKKWVTREYLYGETYKPKLLPGFSLRIDPHR